VIALLAENIWQHPIVIGLAVGLPTSIGMIFTLRRTFRQDDNVKQAAIATGTSQSISQVIDGLNGMIENLQEDREYDRQSVIRHRDNLKECRVDAEALEIENSVLRRKIRSLEMTLANNT
jgi:hypothetical protein